MELDLGLALRAALHDEMEPLRTALAKAVRVSSVLPAQRSFIATSTANAAGTAVAFLPGPPNNQVYSLRSVTVTGGVDGPQISGATCSLYLAADPNSYGLADLLIPEGPVPNYAGFSPGEASFVQGLIANFEGLSAGQFATLVMRVDIYDRSMVAGL